MFSYCSEEKYEGPEAIVVAMDIGTTQSEPDTNGWARLIYSLGAVSFAHFIPGIQTKAKTVFTLYNVLSSISPSSKAVHWPGQPHWASAKVRTLS